MMFPQSDAVSSPVLGDLLRKRLSAKRVSRSPVGYHPWLTLFLFATFFFQLLLIPQSLFPYRTYFRIALFASSLLMLLLVPGRIRWLPLTYVASLITCLYCLQLFHPENNSPISSAASIALNFAILSPALWVSRLRLNASHLRCLLLMLWAFNALSSGLGILEVYLPGRFSRESKIAAGKDGELADALKVTLADGTSIYRPMGFTDSPGGASVSGYVAVLIASGLLVTRCSFMLRVACLASIVCGMFCIYLCQVRSVLILTFICEAVMLFVLALRGKIYRAAGLLLVLPVLITVATFWAFAVGGDELSNRISTLTESKAGQVYYMNRGRFLEETVFGLLPEYPLGAGLGRWGMVHLYFGEKGKAASQSIWAEIQPTAWLLDGGVPLVLCYYAGLLLCIGLSISAAIHQRDEIADLATPVAGLNVAMLATTFGSIPFIGQAGLTFWLINSALAAIALRPESGMQRKDLISKRPSLDVRLGCDPVRGQSGMNIAMNIANCPVQR